MPKQPRPLIAERTDAPLPSVSLDPCCPTTAPEELVDTLSNAMCGMGKPRRRQMALILGNIIHIREHKPAHAFNLKMDKNGWSNIFAFTKTAPEVIRQLEEHGYIYVAQEARANHHQTRWKLTPKLEALLEDGPEAAPEPKAIIIIREGKDGHSGPLYNKNLTEAQTDEAAPMLTRLQAYRDMMDEHTITHADGTHVELGAVQRIFNNDTLAHGGRYYHNISNMTGSDRKRLLIDGEPVLELDFIAMHNQILYFLATPEDQRHEHGLIGSLGYTDPYASFKPRQAAKLAFMALANHRPTYHPQKVFLSFTNKLEAEGIELQEDPRSFLEDVRTHFPHLEAATTGPFAPTKGAPNLAHIIMRVESSITSILLTQMAIDFHEPVVSIHDSYIVKESFADILALQMLEALKAQLDIREDMDVQHLHAYLSIS